MGDGGVMKVNVVALPLKSGRKPGNRAARAKLVFVISLVFCCEPFGAQPPLRQAPATGQAPRQGGGAGRGPCAGPPTPFPRRLPPPPPLSATVQRRPGAAPGAEERSPLYVSLPRLGKAASQGHGGGPAGRSPLGKGPSPPAAPARSRFLRSSLPSREAHRGQETHPGAQGGP